LEKEREQGTDEAEHERKGESEKRRRLMNKIGRDLEAGRESNGGDTKPKEFASKKKNDNANDDAEKEGEIHETKATFNVESPTSNTQLPVS
jgi:hypothetical protein